MTDNEIKKRAQEIGEAIQQDVELFPEHTGETRSQFVASLASKIEDLSKRLSKPELLLNLDHYTVGKFMRNAINTGVIWSS